MTLTVGSLFSGIGGIDLGLQRAGMTVKWHSEIDFYACRVLKKHWPDVPNLGNIKEINWKEVEKVDVICGGYPCQPFSTAGKRNGEEDPRHLWPWVREAISELRPQYAILENVRGHLSLGGLSVIGELASIGYDAEWRVISAASVGANHRRDRIVIVAYPSELFSNGGDNNARVGMESETVPEFGNSGGSTDVADTNSSDSPNGGKRPSLPCESGSWRDDGAGSGSDIGQVSVGGTRETPSDVANSDDSGSGTSQCGINSYRSEESQERQLTQFGFSGCSSDVADTQKQCGNGRRNGDIFGQGATDWIQGTVRGKGCHGGFTNWEVEPDVGRVANGIPSRVDRLRGLGNAVVPQVAEIVGRLIIEAHNERPI